MTGTIPKERIEAVRQQVIDRLRKEKKIDGFREGTAPDTVIEQAVGSLEIWRQSAYEVIMLEFPEMIAAEKVAPLGQPQLQLISIPDRGAVSFRVTFFTMPQVQLPEYLTIAQAVPKPGKIETVSDEEVQQTVLDIRRGLYRKEHPEAEMPESEEKLPELTDDQVQEISPTHRDKESFMNHLQESIIAEKNMQLQMEYRQKMLDAIIEKTTMNIPDILIEEDAKRAYEDFKKQAERFNTTVEKYIEAQQMTEAQLMEQFRQDAKKRSEVQLLLNAISAEKHIHPDAKQVEQEMERFKKEITI